MAMLMFACVRNPDAQLQIIFLPIFSFSASSAVYGIVAFETIGLLFFRKSIFDHAAHLGGALFGM
jgi:rhomboid-like protein